MDINEIYEEIVGLDANGNPKSAVSVSYRTVNINSNSVATKMEHVSHHAEVIMEMSENIVEIKLRFATPFDVDLKLFWKVMQLFEDAATNEMSDEVFSVLSFTFIPEKFNGRYYVCATAPLLFSVQAPAPNESANIISAIFRDEDVEFFEMDEEDLARIDSEVDRGLAEEEAAELIEEQKRQERNAFYERRNQLIQKRRGF